MTHPHGEPRHLSDKVSDSTEPIYLRDGSELIRLRHGVPPVPAAEPVDLVDADQYVEVGQSPDGTVQYAIGRAKAGTEADVDESTRADPAQLANIMAAIRRVFVAEYQGDDDAIRDALAIERRHRPRRRRRLTSDPTAADNTTRHDWRDAGGAA